MHLAPPTWRFVRHDLDAGRIDALEPLFADLLDRDLASAGDLRAWLRDESELCARISAERARRYIRKTRDTDDAAAREHYLVMEREVMPRVKVLCDQLDGVFLDCPFRAGLPAAEFGVLVASRETARAIFRAENTLLQAEEAELQTRQQALMGAIAVEFQGRRHTPQQMAPYYLDQDRSVRSAAFEAVLAARRPTWEQLQAIFDDLLKLRHDMARNAGFDSYTPYRFKDLRRFDYGPELCERFHEAVEQVVVPAVLRSNQRRCRRLGIASVRPYDLEVDLEGRPPFRPFAREDELLAIVERTLAAVDPRFAEDFRVLGEHQLLDLMSRPAKAPGGYQYQLEDIRLPFIFCNSVGTHDDVQTLLHEGGHAFHSILCRDEELLAYRHAPIEFAETASMSMELMGLEELGAVYGEEEARRTRRRHLEGLLRILPWIASIDAFQHWVYANPGHDRDARQAAWCSIMDRFDPHTDYEGFADARAHRWTAQGHLFGHPFYYIEYGIAQIAALQVWQAYRRDKRKAVEAWRRGLALGGSRPLPELFAAAGVAFDVSAAMLGRLVADVEAALA